MNEFTRKLAHDAEITKAAAERAQQLLDSARTRCQHHWTQSYDPIVQEAYTIPGDKPGTMGVDWRGSINVPYSEKPRWARTCSACGKVEHTFHTDEHVTKTPRF